MTRQDNIVGAIFRQSNIDSVKLCSKLIVVVDQIIDIVLPP